MKHYWIPIVIIILALALGLVVMFYVNKGKDSDSTITSSSSSSTISSTSSQESEFATYNSQTFTLQFKYKKVLGTATPSINNTSGCDSKALETISLTKKYDINIYANTCNISVITASPVEQYKIISEDNKTFNVIIFDDAFTPDLKHIRVRGDKFEITGRSSDAQIMDLKNELRFIVESLTYQL